MTRDIVIHIIGALNANEIVNHRTRQIISIITCSCNNSHVSNTVRFDDINRSPQKMRLIHVTCSVFLNIPAFRPALRPKTCFEYCIMIMNRFL